MDSPTANQAKTQFGNMLLKAQREALKLQNIQTRAVQAQQDIVTGDIIDGDAFFEQLTSGQHD